MPRVAGRDASRANLRELEVVILAAGPTVLDVEFAVMFAEDDKSYSEAECFAEFDRLFPHGFAGDDVIREIAPQGWANSPLMAVFHPSADQAYEECVRIHRNLQSFAG